MRRFGILGLLYFVQGLPFGFQTTALPVYLRSEGASLAAVGFASALSLPWMLKALWAPAVDRYHSPRWGRRRSWILPMQVGLFLACVAAANVSPDEGLLPLLILVGAMNLFAATMDIAVDGLAIDLLEEHELGHGNIAQVVGYKVGMITGGGLLVWATESLGWSALFWAMAGLVLVASVLTLLWREPQERARGGSEAPAHLKDVLGLLARALRSRSSSWLLVFIGTYKLGEIMADVMFKPFLVDSGYSPAQIGLWVGTWGMGFSLAGSFLGGMLASRVGLLRVVFIAAVARAVAVAMEAWLAFAGTSDASVIGVTAYEHFAGGALTTAMFALMMSRVDVRIGATHYTLLATIEVLGKLPGAWFSGVIAEHFGYSGLFSLAAALSFAFLFLLIPLSRAPKDAELEPEDAIRREGKAEGVVDGEREVEPEPE